MPETQTITPSLPITAYNSDSKLGSLSPKNGRQRGGFLAALNEWEGAASLSVDHSSRWSSCLAPLTQETAITSTQCEWSQTLEQAAQRNCGFSILGDIQSPTEHGPQRPDAADPALSRGCAGWPPELQLHYPYSAMPALGELCNASFRRRSYVALGTFSPLLLFSPRIQQNRRELEGENWETGTLLIDIQLNISVVNTEGTRVSFFLLYLCCPDADSFSHHSAPWYVARAYKHLRKKHKLVASLKNVSQVLFTSMECTPTYAVKHMHSREKKKTTRPPSAQLKYIKRQKTGKRILPSL